MFWMNVKCYECDFTCKRFGELSKHIGTCHTEFTKQSYYDKYMKKSADEGICAACGKPTGFVNIGFGYHKYCSRVCNVRSAETKQKTIETSMAKYGVSNIAKSPIRTQKSRETKLAKYGNPTFTNPEKARATSLERYNVEYPIQCKEIEQKRDKSRMPLYGSAVYNALMRDRYDVDTPMQSEELKRRHQAVVREKYDVDNVFQIPSVVLAIKKTKLDRYNDENYNNRSKSMQTCLNIYGVPHPQQSHDIRVLQQQRYLYNGQHFDSSWELAYMLWLKSTKIAFEYQPDIKFKYVYDGTAHWYFPDFMVAGELVEIKGPHFFITIDGVTRMINPYDRNQDGKYDAKYKCMMENGVRIITDCTEQLEYVERTYGADYLRQFKQSVK